MKRKVCKKCRVFVEGDKCPICRQKIFSNNFQGRVYVNDPEKSNIAINMEFHMKGEYAIKVK